MSTEGLEVLCICKDEFAVIFVFEFFYTLVIVEVMVGLYPKFMAPLVCYSDEKGCLVPMNFCPGVTVA